MFLTQEPSVAIRAAREILEKIEARLLASARSPDLGDFLAACLEYGAHKRVWVGPSFRAWKSFAERLRTASEETGQRGDDARFAGVRELLAGRVRIPAEEQESFCDQAIIRAAETKSGVLSGLVREMFVKDVEHLPRCNENEISPPSRILLNVLDAHEPNDDILSATPIAEATPTKAAIMDEKDVDFFYMKSGDAQALMLLKIESESTFSLRPKVDVLDGSKTNLGSQHNTTSGGEVTYTFKAQPNMTYYIRVGDYDTKGWGPYTLTVSRR